MNRDRLVALCRLLLKEGHMTPIAERMLLKTYDEDASWPPEPAIDPNAFYIDRTGRM